jgi:spermidine/putrescine transport system substrate-binding protein
VLGHSLNTDDQGELREAFTYLKQQAPTVLTYDYAITVMQDQGELADRLYMAQVYGGDQHTLNSIAGQPGLWRYSVPTEGTILWVDCLAVIRDSPRKALALEFIDFLNRPGIAAMNAELIGFGTPNLSAIGHLSQAYQTDPSVFPADDIVRRSQQYEVLDKDNIILRKRITSAVRKIHESQ